MKPYLSLFLCLFFLLPLGAYAQRDKGKKNKKVAWHYLSDTKTAAEIAAVENKLERLYYMFAGEFSNEEQAKTHHTALFQHQDLICVPIWRERKNEYWLYWGWFKHGQPEQSLAQGVLQLTRPNRDTFELNFYQLPNEADNNYYAFEWQKEKPFANLRTKDLIFEEGKYVITELEDNIFRLHPLPAPHHFDMSDKIKHVNFHVEITPDTHRHFTAFFDEKKQRVLGYDDTPDGNYFFRLPKDQPQYLPTKGKKKK